MKFSSDKKAVKKGEPLKAKKKKRFVPPTPKLYPYQTAGVKMMHDRTKFSNTGVGGMGDRVLLGDEMGLGKTAQALMWYKNYHMEAGPLVVICPSIVKTNWRREAAKFIGVDAEVLSGMTPPSNAKQLLAKAKIIIINFEILGSTGGKRPTWAKVIQHLKPGALVVDEGQRIKNMIAKCTKNVARLCRPPATSRYKAIPNIAILSGTPAVNRPIELWPMLNILRPDKFKTSEFKKFAFKFCEPKWSPWGWTFPGAKNLPILYRRLKKYVMIRRKAADVLPDLPALTRVIVPIEPSEKAMRKYRTMEADFIGWLSRTAPHRATKARKAERLVRMQALRKEVGELKLPYVHEWLDNFLEESPFKIIMFGSHKEVVRGSYEKYTDKAVLVDGGVTGKRRDQATDNFRDDKRIRILFGNAKAAGTGYNGQAAQSVGFMEIGWTPGEIAQCIARALRIGQENHVMAYFFVVPNTIEEKLLHVNQQKQNHLDQMFDGASEEHMSLNIYDELEEMMLASGKKKSRGYYDR